MGNRGRAAMLAAAVATAAALGGCAATGPSYQEMARSTPPLRADQGRVYFLRQTSFFGNAVRPELHLDGEVVGRSEPGGYFFVDSAPGSHVASGSTEVETRFPFILRAGETKYLHSEITFGIVIGRLSLREFNAGQAQALLPEMAYTGEVGRGSAADPPEAAASAKTVASTVEVKATTATVAARSQTPSMPPASAPAPAADTRMEDLRYLLSPR